MTVLPVPVVPFPRSHAQFVMEPSASPEESGTPGGTVVLATHESFHLPKRLVRAFEAETGYDLEVRAAGDAGTLATKLSLTADNPIADAEAQNVTDGAPRLSGDEADAARRKAHS